MRDTVNRWRPGVAAMVCALYLVMPGAARGTDIWSLKRCQEEALRISHPLRAGAARVDGADAAARTAGASRWPTLGVSGTYAYTSEVMELHLPAFPGLTLPDIRFGDGNVYDLSVVATVPLFTGGTLRARAKAEAAGWRAARHDLAADSLRVLSDVRAAYFRALGAEAQAGAARVAEERLRRHVGELDGAIAAGGATEEARIQVLARLRQAEQLRIQAETAASAARLDLARLVGRPGQEVTPAGDLRESLVPEDLRRRTEIGPRPELSALEERTRQSRRQAEAARGAYLPSISAQLSYHHAKPGVDMVADEWMDYGTAGIVLSWSLWDWGARSQRIRQARAVGRALEEQRAELESALETRLAAARTALGSAEEQMQKAEERVELERRRFDMVDGRYRNAAATESERLDSGDDLAAAEMDLETARARVRLAESELLYVLGRE